MFELQGSQTNAIVYTDNVDQKTIGQIITMLNEPITTNATVRIMPDTHYGAGATIGTTIKLPENRSDWKVAPSIVGVDLSCAMMSYRIKETDIDLEQLDKIVNLVVPAGARLHAKAHHSKAVSKLIEQLSFNISDKDHHMKALGTLGGGNHFIELAKDEDGRYWLTVHSGSRSFGASIAKHHEKIATQYQNDYRDELNQLITDLKNNDQHKNIDKAIKSY